MNQGLKCHRLTFSRHRPNGDEKQIIGNLNATFSPGSLTVISGETGVGKTTLLYLLAGLLRPTQGEVHANGKPVSRWVSAHQDLWRREVGIVFQSDRLISDLSALENVYLPLIPRGYSLSDCRRLATQALVRLQADGLTTETVRKLSGGERQQIAIARAIVASPSYLLADEPTAHQDQDSASVIMDALLEVAATGTVVVVMAHDTRILASGIYQYCYQLDGGQLRISE
jgi:ABC-type lipoprotein export system ATPase subunit